MKYWLIAMLLCIGQWALAAPQVQVSALFKGTAVLTINGQQRMLKDGQRSPEGVLLVSAGPQQAVIEIDGKQMTVGLSQLISGSYQAVESTEVAIPRNGNNQYITFATINGRRQQVLVDTGANSVAMSSTHARSLGIDYKKGRPAMVSTASGTAQAYFITLRSIAVGGITVSGVEAGVVEGDYPLHILLGMTYLQHVNMREESGTLFLQAKF